MQRWWDGRGEEGKGRWGENGDGAKGREALVPKGRKDWAWDFNRIGVNLSEVAADRAQYTPDRRGVAFVVFSSIGCRRRRLCAGVAFDQMRRPGVEVNSARPALKELWILPRQQGAAVEPVFRRSARYALS